ncbi:MULTISPECIES: L-lactate permease [unclassified Pseudoclavibacter]|uniref:L-lactate permease n=1 Tax=unclassified Pseudoclavibacter TaxID=2615177 RepID=UPI0013014BA0|nr:MULTISPECIES: L-lactate permease [unclassified Pseudoclavibacter]KAB1645532.1 L-lactate permease [Pseudoclavibacter sp. CFCC 14310]KAB1646009.1 L-lactate permease [Pseudoclavibacter sp. CFCC 14310]KAB1663685.1 L-lactate permease [Pseudoclavibacter sp. CFCC 13611]KAB1664566.1 L-lactate permease [Pseudoclavibacter sp. CFCC 13611]
MSPSDTAVLLSDGFTPNLESSLIGGSLPLTALVSLIPLVVFFVLLGGFKISALRSGLGALLTAMLVAIFGMKMSVGLTFAAATQGAVFGLFPIMWIVITAIWFYEVTVLSGRSDDLRRIFSSVGRGDMRIQAVLIAFCFGGLLEALAGFGAPVAITGVMLVALGLPPLRAALAVLVANTAPVAFGAMAVPITTAGNLTAGDGDKRAQAEAIAQVVGVQTPLIAWVVPILLLLILDGFRGVRQLWFPALVTGLTFSVLQWWCAHHFVYELTDVVAALGGFLIATILLKFWKPTTPEDQMSKVKEEPLTGVRVWMALLPYIIVIALFGFTKLWTMGANIPKLLAGTDLKIPWPGLSQSLMTADGKISSSATYTLTWLSSPGTTLLIAGIIVAIVFSIFTAGGKFSMTVGQALAEFWHTIVKSRISLATVATVLSIAYVMNLSGQTIWIGQWLAATGVFFAFLSPILGWLGTAVTGSDTSANALFAKLQQTAAHQIGINEHLLTAANTSGGVVGKMISPQNLTIAATSVDLKGQESTILRKALPWSLGLLLIVCIIVFLQSTPVLGWMIPA